jgi:uncharacterized protein YjbJ (UPF0337 family)
MPARQTVFITSRKGIIMNWEQIQGNWKQVTGKAKEQWGKLTDDDMDVIAGKRDQLSGKIQQHYGVAKEEAEKQITAWSEKGTDAWLATSDKPVADLKSSEPKIEPKAM